jgi:hypothetical protein
MDRPRFFASSQHHLKIPKKNFYYTPSSCLLKKHLASELVPFSSFDLGVLDSISQLADSKMAVVKSLPGVKISVYSSGQKLKEYRIKKGSPGSHVDKGKSVSRLIKAATDAEFSFRVHVSNSYQLACPTLLFSLYVDGMSVGGVLCGEYELIHGSWTKHVEGVKQPTEKRNVVGLRKFTFSELATGKHHYLDCCNLLTAAEESIDSERLTRDRQSVLRIGELRVLVHRCSSFYALHRRPVDLTSELPTISEKAWEKREISHGTTYAWYISCIEV